MPPKRNKPEDKAPSKSQQTLEQWLSPIKKKTDISCWSRVSQSADRNKIDTEFCHRTDALESHIAAGFCFDM